MELGRVFIDDVFIGTRHRSLDSSRVESLAESIKAIGLQTPISVYVDGDDHAHLVAGLHRLEAARHLGWERIDANFVKMDDVERELWEIAENLHRVELTKEQRDEHIRRYAQLIESRDDSSKTGQTVQFNDVGSGQAGPGRGRKSTATKVAEETGVKARTVRRILNAPPVDYETERQRKESEQRRREQDKAMRAVAAEEYAEWLLRQIDLDQLPTLISWIEASPPRDLIAAVRRLSGETPVMDARYGDHDASPFLDRRGTQ